MFEFRPFHEPHLALLRQWLSEEHIRPFWQEPEGAQDLRQKFLVELPKRGVHAFIIARGTEPIGFIQYYNASTIGGGWWADEKPGTFGIDLMIGDPLVVGRGVGAEIIREFITFIENRESSVTSFIIDPEPGNARAIKAFAKAGFVSESEIQTPGGKALLMRMRR